MKAKVLGICLLSVLFIQGCGTIVHGTRQDISINSKPTGAKASVADLTITTPSSVSLSRDKDYVVTVEKEGYQPKQAQITRSFNGGTTILGNILWLLPGVVVDLVAGGAWTLNPEAVDVELESTKTALQAPVSVQPAKAVNVAPEPVKVKTP